MNKDLYDVYQPLANSLMQIAYGGPRREGPRHWQTRVLKWTIGEQVELMVII